MIKYKTSGITARIVPIEVLRETDNSVYLPYGPGEKLQAKRSERGSYHDTWRGAQRHLIHRVQNKIDILDEQKRSLQRRIREISGMKQPTTSGEASS